MYEPSGRKLLSVAIDKETGTNIWVSYWESDELFVSQRDSDLTTIGTDESFGAATEAELNDDTYSCFVKTIKDASVSSNEDRVLIYGKMARTS